MDLNGIYSLLKTYQNGSATSSGIDSSEIASQLTKKLLANRDSDGDGYLASTDVSELSSEAFSKLDSDGDGKLSSDEITSAFEGQLESLKLATQLGTASGRGTIATLRKSAAGALMQAVNSAGPYSSSDSTSTTSTTSSGDSTSILDVTA